MLQKKVAMSPSSTVHEGQYDNKYLVHMYSEHSNIYMVQAEFVGEGTFVVYLEPAPTNEEIETREGITI